MEDLAEVGFEEGAESDFLEELALLLSATVDTYEREVNNCKLLQNTICITSNLRNEVIYKF